MALLAAIVPTDVQAQAAGHEAGVEVVQSDAVTKQDPGAHGIFARSVGGNGGDGGTSGDASGGFSVGGDGTGGNAIIVGGGNATAGDGAGGAATGGSARSGDANGSAGAAGGSIRVNSSGTIVVTGDGAHGIAAESIGGDGGDGGVSGDATGGNGRGGAGIGGNATAGTDGLATGGDGTGGAGIGGDARSGDALGGDGGRAGPVFINNSGSVSTFGEAGHGISAVSQGGNGGDGGMSGAALGGGGFGGTGIGGTATGATSIDGSGFGGAGLGGDARSGDTRGGAGGAGGLIEIDNRGSVATFGAGAHGISTQNRGGQGGNAGTSGAATGGAGTGGIGVGATGMPGTEADGGSVRGGSGAGAAAGAGTTSIRNSGSVLAHGQDAHGIFAESEGGDVQIVLDDGEVMGGLGAGAGLRLDGGSQSVAIGSGASLAAHSGLAIHATDGDTMVENRGLVTGNVRLEGDGNVFNNRRGGVFVPMTLIDLSGDMLTNAGVVNLGGTGDIVTTELDGDFSQEAGGQLLFDARFAAGTSDRLEVGGMASLDGAARINLLELDRSERAVTLITSAGGFDEANLTVLDTPVVDFALTTSESGAANSPDGRGTVTARIKGVDFTPAELARNQESLGAHFNEVFAADGRELNPILTLLANAQTLSEYAAALDRLHPEPYLAVGQSEFRAARFFADELSGCRDRFDRVATDKGRCVWGRVQGRSFDQDKESDRIGIDEGVISLATGVEAELSEAWTLGGAVGYEFASSDVDDRADISTDRVQAGFMAERLQGSFMFGLGLSGGYSWSDMDRFINLGPGDPVATSEPEAGYLSGRATIGYGSEIGRVTLMPRLDADLTHVRVDDVNESGGGPLSLRTQSLDETFLTLRPGVEIGTELTSGGGAVLRPYVFAGLSWTDDPSFSVDAVFEGTPEDVDPFTVSSDTDSVLGEVAVGLDVLTPGRAGFDLQYGLRGGESSLQHTGALRLDVRF